VKFTRRHLLERSRVKNIIHPAHGPGHAACVTHIANVELELGMVVALAHVILLFLIAAEDADFSNIRIQEALENSIAERTGTTGDKKAFFFKQDNPLKATVRY